MKTTKDILFAAIEAKLTQDLPSISQANIRRCAEAVAVIANQEVKNGADAINKLYADLVTKNEQHKALFRQHIELITKHTNILFAILNEHNLVKKKTDKSGKTILVGNSVYTNGLINFLTQLDDSVRKFYVDVYEVEEPQEAKESGFTQTSLF